MTCKRNASAGLSSDADAANVRHRVRLVPKHLPLHVPLRLMQQMSSAALPKLPCTRRHSKTAAESCQSSAQLCLEPHLTVLVNSEPHTCWSGSESRLKCNLRRGYGCQNGHDVSSRTWTGQPGVARVGVPGAHRRARDAARRRAAGSAEVVAVVAVRLEPNVTPAA